MKGLQLSSARKLLISHGSSNFSQKQLSFLFRSCLRCITHTQHFSISFSVKCKTFENASDWNLRSICNYGSSSPLYWCFPVANKDLLSCKPTIFLRSFSASANESKTAQDYLEAQDLNILTTLQSDMTVIPNFLTEEEEKSLFDEVDRYMKRLRYEYDHWDNAIHGYRETEKKSWNEANQIILNRVKDLAFHPGVAPLAYVHVLDISKEGYIKPHVDAIRFCGDTITGMCLLSSCVMRLALEKDPSKYGDIYLPQRCLYIMKGKARYDFTHEVLKEEESKFKGQVVPRDRRISVICRNEPRPEDTE